jgi:hypothetical protein
VIAGVVVIAAVVAVAFYLLRRRKPKRPTNERHYSNTQDYRPRAPIAANAGYTDIPMSELSDASSLPAHGPGPEARPRESAYRPYNTLRGDNMGHESGYADNVGGALHGPQ